MSYAKARSHARAAQYEQEQAAAGGVFITREKRNRLVIAAAVIIILAFVKGLILGYCFFHGAEEDI